MNDTAAKETSPTKPESQSAVVYVPLILCVVGMLLSPLAIAHLTPAAAAGWWVLGIFAAVTLVCGLWFGAVTTPTWWFPVTVGIGFLVTGWLYFQGGVFLYGVGFALLAGLGTLLTGANKLDLDDEEQDSKTEEAEELGELEAAGESVEEVPRGNMDS